MFERFKIWLRRLLPVYRIGNTLLDRAEHTEQMLTTRLNQMDAKLEYLFWLTQRTEGEELADTRKRVFLSMPPAQHEARLIQLANLFILRRLKTLCDSSGIQFSLVFGTLIGAVRHHGFIPWDDDIDIGILREDFQKLRALLQADEHLRLDVYYSVNCYQFAKVKLRGSDTFFVDVFIFDSFDADERNYQDRYQAIFQSGKNYECKIGELFRKYGICPSTLIAPVQHTEMEQEMNRFYEEEKNRLPFYGHGEYLCFGIDNPSFIRHMGYAYQIADLFPLIKDSVIFEGDRYDVFPQWDLWLRNCYGDYWSMPRNIVTGHSDLKGIKREDLAVLVQHNAMSSDGLSLMEEYKRLRNEELKIRF